MHTCSTLSRIYYAGKILRTVKECVLNSEQPRAARILGTSASGLAFAVSDRPETYYGTPPLTYVTMCRRALGLPAPPPPPPGRAHPRGLPAVQRFGITD